MAIPSASDVADAVDKGVAQSPSSRSVSNSIDVERDPRLRKQTTPTKQDVYAMASTVSLLPSPQDRTLQSLHTPKSTRITSYGSPHRSMSTSKSPIRQVPSRIITRESDAQTLPQDATSLTHAATPLRHQKSQRKRRAVTDTGIKKSTLSPARSAFVTALSKTPKQKITSPSSTSTTPVADAHPLSPRRSTFGGDTSSRLLSDSRGEITYIKGVGMVRADDGHGLESAPMSESSPSKRPVLGDMTLMIKTVSTKAQHISAKELQWIAEEQSLIVPYDKNDQLYISAADMSTANYNMDISSMYINVRKASMGTFSGEVIFVVDGHASNCYRLRTLLEKCIGATKVNRVGV